MVDVGFMGCGGWCVYVCVFVRFLCLCLSLCLCVFELTSCA